MKTKAFFWPEGKVVQGKVGGNVKKQNQVSGPYATATVAGRHGDAKDRTFGEIVPDGPFWFLERIAHKPRKKEFTSFRLILGSISFRTAS